MELKITPSGQTIVKPTALGPGANTDTKLLIYGLFQKGRVLAQDGSRHGTAESNGATGAVAQCCRQSALAPVFVEVGVHVVYLSEVGEIVSNINEFAFLAASHRWSPESTSDHLTVKDHRSRRSGDKHHPDPWCIESGRQDTVVEKDVELTCAKLFNDMTPMSLPHVAIDVCAPVTL